MSAKQRPEAKGGGDERKPRLTRDAVLAEAMCLLDEEGLDALTMRNLADRLGVVPMALYRHVANKDDLLDGVLDAAVASVPLPPSGLGWREGMSALARSIRSTMLCHPALAAKVVDRPSLGPASLVIGEWGLALLRGAGLSDELADRTFNLILVYTLGFVTVEVPRLPGTDGSITLSNAEADDFFATLPPEEFPNTLAVRPRYTTFVDDQQFEFGLACLLDGIERTAARR